MFGVRVSGFDVLLASYALSRRVADFGSLARTATVDLLQHGAIDFFTKGKVDRKEVKPVAIGGQLHAVCKAALNIINEILAGGPIAASDHPGANQLGIGIHRYPGPGVSGFRATLPNLGRYVALFGCHRLGGSGSV